MAPLKILQYPDPRLLKVAARVMESATSYVETVGEFVRYCIRPKLEQTEPEKEKGKDDKKK